MADSEIRSEEAKGSFLTVESHRHEFNSQAVNLYHMTLTNSIDTKSGYGKGKIHLDLRRAE